MQGYTLTSPIYLLPISGVEVILGVAWLSTLGLHMVDYKALSIQFYYNNQFITWSRERDCGPQPPFMYY